MWQIKKFKTHEKLVTFLKNNIDVFQMTEIFINNGYAVEYKRLRVIDLV